MLLMLSFITFCFLLINRTSTTNDSYQIVLFIWIPIKLTSVNVVIEVGYIYAYKAGWPVSVAQIVQAAVLAVILIFVGYLLYKEAITWNKIVGIIVCLAGLWLINMK